MAGFGENIMLEHSGLPVMPRARPGAGTWIALALFGLISWWLLWAAAIEPTNGPTGYDWVFTAALAGIVVSRWLARYAAERLGPPAPSGKGWFDSGSAIYVGAALLVPGSACWLILRIILAYHRQTTRGRSRRLCHALTALWASWALAGTTGQIILIWELMTGVSGTDVMPDIIFGAASLLNAASITALMCIEPTVGTAPRRTPATIN